MDKKDPQQQWSWKITKHHGLWNLSRSSRKKILRHRRRERRRQRAVALWQESREQASWLTRGKWEV